MESLLNHRQSRGMANNLTGSNNILSSELFELWNTVNPAETRKWYWVRGWLFGNLNIIEVVRNDSMTVRSSLEHISVHLIQTELSAGMRHGKWRGVELAKAELGTWHLLHLEWLHLDNNY